MTGRDPLIIPQGSRFYSLILKAVEHDSEKRHENIEQFVQQYEKLKTLYLHNAKVPTYETVEQYLANSKEKVEWALFQPNGS